MAPDEASCSSLEAKAPGKTIVKTEKETCRTGKTRCRSPNRIHSDSTSIETIGPSKRSNLQMPSPNIKKERPVVSEGTDSSLQQNLSSPEPKAVYLEFLREMTASPPSQKSTSPAKDPRLQRRRSKARERERDRVKNMKEAFHLLQNSMYFIPRETTLSKIKALKFAIQYIRYLTDMLNQSSPHSPKLVAGDTVPRAEDIDINFHDVIAPAPPTYFPEESFDREHELSELSTDDDESACASDCSDIVLPWSSAVITGILSENLQGNPLLYFAEEGQLQM